ncbi:MAG: SoxR reducing system RseC family protein [Granulosicoccus sp.]|nr:SoxR reducing system RseC family protein [Granulosicoccus sp.]
MKTTARAITPASAGDSITVELRNVSACARCSRGQGCGAGLFGQGGVPLRLTCVSEHDVLAEDPVVVEFDDGDAGWLWLVAGAYGLPLLGMLLTTLSTQAALSAGLLLSLLPDFPVQGVPVDLAIESWKTDLILGAAALIGLTGGVIAWRVLAPMTLARLESRLCVESGRIVAVGKRPANVFDTPV